VWNYNKNRNLYLKIIKMNKFNSEVNKIKISIIQKCHNRDSINNKDIHNKDIHNRDTHNKDTHNKDTHNKDTHNKDTHKCDNIISN